MRSVRQLLVDASHVQTVFAGASEGRGLFRSNDAGLTWTALPSSLIETVQAMTLTPLDSDTLFVASSYPGAYVAKSTDQGASFTRAQDGITMRIYALAADPNDGARLWAGAGYAGHSQVFRTLDGGATWRPAGEPPGGDLVRGLLVDPVAQDTVYAATQGNGVYRSVDGGVSWRAISTGLWNLNPTRLSLSAGDRDTIYAATAGGGVFALTFSPPAVTAGCPLPAGDVDLPYSATLSASGGAPPSSGS